MLVSSGLSHKHEQKAGQSTTIATYDLLAVSEAESLSLSADSELVSEDEEDAELEESELNPVGCFRSTCPATAATSGLRACTHTHTHGRAIRDIFLKISCHSSL